MPISQFEQLEQLATTDYFAARCLGDILSGWVPMEWISIDYARALQYYVLGDFLTPKKYKVWPLPSWVDYRLPVEKLNLLTEAMRMPTKHEINRLLII
jgi:hypothetical protein